MTRRLAQIFRKSLEDLNDNHTLADELEFIENYLSIERVRFGEKLAVSNSIEPEAAMFMVPSMILQPLVENAVKHGISRTAEGGLIEIRARRRDNGVEITIENDGPAEGPYDFNEMLSRGFGLRNVVERLEIHSCGMGSLELSHREGSGAIVRMFMPDPGNRRKVLDDQGDNCR